MVEMRWVSRNESLAPAVWQEVARLPDETIEEMILVVRGQRNRWAAEDGRGFDLR